MKTNEKHWYRFWVAVIIASIIIHLMGCAIEHEYKDADFRDSDTVYQARMGGLFEENDSIVDGDTLYNWK